MLLDLSSAVDTACQFFISCLSEISITGSALLAQMTESIFWLYKGTNPPLLLWHKVFLRVQFLVHFSSTCVHLATLFLYGDVSFIAMLKTSNFILPQSCHLFMIHSLHACLRKKKKVVSLTSLFVTFLHWLS